MVLGPECRTRSDALRLWCRGKMRLKLRFMMSCPWHRVVEIQEQKPNWSCPASGRVKYAISCTLTKSSVMTGAFTAQS